MAYFDEEVKKMEEKREKERQAFFDKCLSEIDGRDAYTFLIHSIANEYGIDVSYNTPEPIWEILKYYINNKENFDCSLAEWLKAENGPIVKYSHSVHKLFPELALISDNKREIVQMANEHYNANLKFDWEGDYVYSLEFNFADINSKRVDIDKVKEIVKETVQKEMEV